MNDISFIASFLVSSSHETFVEDNGCFFGVEAIVESTVPSLEVSHPYHDTCTPELSRNPRPASRCNTRLGRRTRIDGQRQKTE